MSWRSRDSIEGLSVLSKSLGSWVLDRFFKKYVEAVCGGSVCIECVENVCRRVSVESGCGECLWRVSLESVKSVRVESVASKRDQPRSRCPFSAIGGSEAGRNFRRLVLGCINADFCR